MKRRTQCPYCSLNVRRRDNLGRDITKLHREELLATAVDEDQTMIRRVLRKGTFIERKNENGQTLLSQAVEGGSEAVVKLLLNKGANIESYNDYGTPLCEAASNGHIAIVELLLSKGANIESTDYRGWTPLKQATDACHTAIAQLLRGYNAEPGLPYSLASE